MDTPTEIVCADNEFNILDYPFLLETNTTLSKQNRGMAADIFNLRLEMSALRSVNDLLSCVAETNEVLRSENEALKTKLADAIATLALYKSYVDDVGQQIICGDLTIQDFFEKSFQYSWDERALLLHRINTLREELKSKGE